MKDCENLVYIANFEKNSGYAILAADNRISDKVIALTDSGFLDDKTVYSAIELNNSDRILLKDYPTDGPGFFTLPQYGDELFMNPNTLSLYDESFGDTLVGNFRLDDIGAEDENGKPIISTNIDYDLELLTSSLCTAYAIKEVHDFDHRENIHREGEVDSMENLSDNNFWNTKYEYTYSDWTTKQATPNLLSTYRNWSQDTPFNDLYPKRRKYILFGHKRNAPAGCFPLAIAKVLTHFEFPNSFSYNGHTVNWKMLKSSVGVEDIDHASAAALLRGISGGCDCWYFYAGTFAFPSNVTSFMRRIGIPNAHSHKYTTDRVVEMIDNGKPLIIYSIPGINIFKSHSWNIDGYKIRERIVTTKTYKGSSLQKTSDSLEQSIMVHCDFGWKGSCNGYYVSGIFKLNDPQSEKDYTSDSGKSTHYNNLLKVITYDMP